MGRYSEFESSLSEVVADIRTTADLAGTEMAESWAQGMIEVMAESEPGGTLYWYPGIGWTRASAPGQPPAIQSGGYVQSVTSQKSGKYTYEAGSPELLGLWLEKGTADIKPRPHVYEGYQRNQAEIERALYERWGELE